MLEPVERIGVIHLGCNLKDKKDSTKIYFTVCKKSHKVSLINTNRVDLVPFMIVDTHINKMNNTCLDGDYCLNIDCEYCTSPNLEHSVSRTMKSFYKEYPKHAVEFTRDNIEWVNNTLTKDMFKDSTSSVVYPNYMEITSNGVKSE